MKKVSILTIAVCLAAALFAGCAIAPRKAATEKPVVTQQPEVTDKPTEAPATAAPTPTAEPTPEPAADPFAFEIEDWDDMDTTSFSFDTIKYNGKIMTDGGVLGYRADIDDTVDGTDGKISTVTMRGWAGFLEENFVKIGYQIDDGPVVWAPKGFEATSEGVKAAGGEFAQRFSVDIPVGNLTGKQHELKIVSLLESGTCVYMNPGINPFVLNYDGPDAAQTAVDGTVDPHEYAQYFVMDKSNSVSWTKADIGSTKIEYYLSQKDDGLYVGVKAKGVAAGDFIQFNFNPGGFVGDKPGLFVSFKVGDTLTVLQHNHKTGLIDNDSAGGADITSLVESAAASDGDSFEFEAKLPAELFTITDVEAGSDFVYGTNRIYFGMFAIIGGNGFTNQSAAPGSDWSANGLGLSEYFLV